MVVEIAAAAAVAGVENKLIVVSARFNCVDRGAVVLLRLVVFGKGHRDNVGCCLIRAGIFGIANESID